MKVLFLADVHGEETVLERLAEKAGLYDMVVVGGDIGTSVSFVKEFLGVTDRMFVIPGNNDPKELAALAGDKYLQGKRAELGEGLNLVGFGFSPPTPFRTPGEISEEEMYEGMSKLSIDRKTILVTHAPPKGLLDEVLGIHAGSEAVRKIMEEKEPLALVCGHIHEREGKEKVGATTVLKLAPASRLRGGLIEVEDGRITLSNVGL